MNIYLLCCTLLSIIVIASVSPASAATLGDSALTGKTLSQVVDLKIHVLGLPTLILLSPKNGTYLANDSLLLNYSVSGADNVWYGIDGSNNTILSVNSSYTYFNVSDGSHILSIYANNSEGLSTKNVSFVVNSTRFVIIYRKEFRNANSGASTDFYTYIFEEILQNLEGVVLENINYGKIKFNGAINLTDDKNKTDNILDIESNINISFNRIELNSVELPNFNFSAALYLYNLSFINPRILRDGLVCPSSICFFEDYSAGTLKFNVSRFSIYSAEETPTGEISAGGAAAGAAGNISGRPIEKRCDAPYVLIEGECCMDRNNNKICDYRDFEIERPEEKAKIMFKSIDAILALIAIILLIVFLRLLLLKSKRN